MDDDKRRGEESELTSRVRGRWDGTVSGAVETTRGARDGCVSVRNGAVTGDWDTDSGGKRSGEEGGVVLGFNRGAPTWGHRSTATPCRSAAAAKSLDP
jgi:hypothetical protein